MLLTISFLWFHVLVFWCFLYPACQCPTIGILCAKQLLSQKVLCQKLLQQRTFAPEAFYTAGLLHQKHLYTTSRNLLHQKDLTQTTPYTRRGLCATSLLQQKPLWLENARSANLERTESCPTVRWSKDTQIQHNYVMLSHNILQKLTLHHRHKFCYFFFVALSLSLSLSLSSLTLSVTFCLRDRSLGASCLSNSIIFTSPARKFLNQTSVDNLARRLIVRGASLGWEYLASNQDKPVSRFAKTYQRIS